MTPHDESWTFRIRGTFTSRLRVNTAETELVLSDEPSIKVKLQAGHAETALKDTEVFTLKGIGYSSADLAETEAAAWWDRVMIGFAANRIGADFGIRAPITSDPTVSPFRIVRRPIENDHHGRVQYFNDRSGIQIYTTEPPVGFFHGSANGYAPMAWGELLGSIHAAHAVGARLSDSERLAYDLYAAALSLTPADARVLMLSTALETMITQDPRPAPARVLLEELIKAAENSALDDLQKNSIIGTLKDMHRRESINQAGKRLAMTLGTRDYGGRSPLQFFAAIYKLRSDLVHGDRRPAEERIRVGARQLEQFVSDLLTKSLGNDH